MADMFLGLFLWYGIVGGSALAAVVIFHLAATRQR